MLAACLCLLLSPAAGAAAPPRRYAFELNPAACEKLKRGLEVVRLGDTIMRVKQILGAPDEEMSISRPRIFQPFEFRFTVLDYHVKLVDMNSKNNFDERLELYFNQSGRLYEIVRPPTLAKTDEGRNRKPPP